jgi:hypothetical protein
LKGEKMNALLVAGSLVLGSLCGQSAAARKVAQEIVEVFGRETLDRAEMRVASLIDSFGDDAARALRRVGPEGVSIMERYGASGTRVLARWGDDGVRLLAMEGDDALRALALWGDDAVGFMIRHPGVGRDLLEIFGERALRLPVSTEGAVTLLRLAEPIQASGSAAKILGVVERFGDRTCQFLWRNKGTVFAGTLLVAFLADPEPYLNGVRKLVVEPASEAAREAIRRTNWTLIVLVVTLAAGMVWMVDRRRRARAASGRDCPSGD